MGLLDKLKDEIKESNEKIANAFDKVGDKLNETLSRRSSSRSLKTVLDSLPLTPVPASASPAVSAPSTDKATPATGGSLAPSPQLSRMNSNIFAGVEKKGKESALSDAHEFGESEKARIAHITEPTEGLLFWLKETRMWSKGTTWLWLGLALLMVLDFTRAWYRGFGMLWRLIA